MLSCLSCICSAVYAAYPSLGTRSHMALRSPPSLADLPTASNHTVQIGVALRLRRLRWPSAIPRPTTLHLINTQHPPFDVDSTLLPRVLWDVRVFAHCPGGATGPSGFVLVTQHPPYTFQRGLS